MSEVTREHLAGLKLAHKLLSEMNSRQVSDEACMEIEKLAMKASAAPEQEPVAWITRASLEKLKQGLGLPCEISAKRRLDFGFTEALYTHDDPSEVAQLRALLAKVINSGALSTEQHEELEADICAAVDVVAVLKKLVFIEHLEAQAEAAARLPDYKRECVKSTAREAATQRADAAERKQGELFDLLRVVDRCGLDAVQVSGPTVRQRVRDALLSASAEPASPWVKCSDRLPDVDAHVLVAAEFFGPGDWRIKVGGIDEHGDWTVFGASWTPTRWMPLPAAPAKGGDGEVQS